MFSFDLWFNDVEDDYYECSLSFKNDTLELRFEPESRHLLVEGEKGRFTQRTSNGSYKFSWEGNTLTFSTPKSGYVNGWSQGVVLHLTPEQMASFHDAIHKWNAFHAHVAQGNSATSFGK